MVPAMTEGQDNRDTWFGDRRVGRDQKTMLVRDVFSSVADKYDLMNDLMSVGSHRLWKGAMIDWLNPRAGQSILDVGGGTGDIAFRILQRRPDARVTVCDLTPAMLDQGRDRAVDRGILSGVEWVAGNAEHLPFDAASFDVVTNLESSSCYPDVQAFYREVHRVLAPGGHFLYADCLPTNRFREATLYLEDIGLHVEGNRDITSNVLLSCDAIARQRVQAYGGGSPELETFLGAPGSQYYEDMRGGRWTYRILRLAKQKA